MLIYELDTKVSCWHSYFRFTSMREMMDFIDLFRAHAYQGDRDSASNEKPEIVCIRLIEEPAKEE